MKGWVFVFLGLLTVAGIIYKIMKCASCEDNILGFSMSGYIYLAIQTLFAIILLNGAYVALRKTKNIN